MGHFGQNEHQGPAPLAAPALACLHSVDCLASVKKPGRKRIRKPLAGRLEANTDRSGGPDACHIWRGSVCQKTGYGRIGVTDPETGKRSMRLTHRLAWERHHGRPVPAGMYVLHSVHCRSKLCNNPNHLRIGTHQDNADDAIAAGVMRGRRLNAAKARKIVEIANRRVSGTKEIAIRFGVSHETVRRILTGRAYSKFTGIVYQASKGGRPAKRAPSDIELQGLPLFAPTVRAPAETARVHATRRFTVSQITVARRPAPRIHTSQRAAA